MAVRRFVPTVAAALVVTLCLAAGEWQRARMHYKEDLRARYEAASVAPPLAAERLTPPEGGWPLLRFRPVRLQGYFDPAHQVLLDNRVRDGQPGYEVLAPFRLEDGRTLVVKRGWVAQGRSRADLPAVPPPEGMVTIAGRIELAPAGYVELGPAPATSAPVWQHLDLDRFATRSGGALLPVLVLQTEAAGARDALRRDWPAPDFGVNTHRMYMLQWYAFALTALGFWAATHWPQRWRPRKGAPHHG